MTNSFMGAPSQLCRAVPTLPRYADKGNWASSEAFFAEQEISPGAQAR